MARTLNNLALLHCDTHRFDDAEAEYKEALEIYRRLAVGSPAAYEADVARTLQIFARVYYLPGPTQWNVNRAIECLQESLEIYKRLAKQSPRQYRSQLIKAWLARWSIVFPCGCAVLLLLLVVALVIGLKRWL